MGIISGIKKSFSRNVSSQTAVENFEGLHYSELSTNTRRGVTVYFPTEIENAAARDAQGRMVNAPVLQPYFVLSPEMRVRVVQACSPVLGIITSRMNRVSGRKLTIVSDKEQEDLLVDKFRDLKAVASEFEKSGQLEYIIAAARIKQFLSSKLFTLLPDLSNFEPALLRWSKNNKQQSQQKADSIKNWLMEPNPNTNWEDFVKKWVFDLMTHGACVIYKVVENGKLENLHILPGGTIFPIQEKYVTNQVGYVQIIGMEEYQFFNRSELAHMQYIPISSRSMGLVPLEALVNTVTETLLFDKFMAEQADGTVLPKKMIVVTEQSPFGLHNDETLKLPINKGEQKRLEKKMNTPIKGGVMTFSGNTATVVDLSRENTMPTQMQRQKDIREEVALVFNMSNMEVNLTGSESTSGRSTSESQAEIEQGKGIVPIMAAMENKLTKEIILYRAGPGYSAQFHTEQNEKEEFEKIRLKMATGVFSINEIRTRDLNETPFEGEEYDLPPGANIQGQPDGSTINPFNMRAMG
jgi:phage portal protein BeeE